MESATIHLLTQPVSPGAQTLVVRLTDGQGGMLALDPAPEVAVTWTPLPRGTASPWRRPPCSTHRRICLERSLLER